LFTTTVDFGNAYTGTSNWLAIAVSTNAANAFTTLAPRQQLTPVPYAITAANISGTVLASSISGAVANGNLPTSPTVSGTVTAGAFAGNGASVTNVNAAMLNGLNATNFWQLGGNNVASGQFLGSTNNQPLELHVNAQRALRLEYATNLNGYAVNVIGGLSQNYVTNGAGAATIGGGGVVISGIAISNSVINFYGTVSGGAGNIAGFASVVGGGTYNTSLGQDTTVGGGVNNYASGYGGFIGGGGYDGNLVDVGNTNFGNAAAIVGGMANLIVSGADYSFVGGGIGNTMNADHSMIGGGKNNTALNSYATIPGGSGNEAGKYSFAAGQQAQALYTGDFVWADSQNAAFASSSDNQFLIRASGNVGINTTYPGATLHVANGSSGVSTPNSGSVGAFESSGSCYVNLLTPSANESGILFGNGYGTADGGILYNSGSITRGLQFRTGGNATRMVITSGGNVGIGNTAPGYLLVVGNAGSPAYCNGGNWVNASDRNMKQNFASVPAAEVLAKVVALPVQSWDYKAQPGEKHIGPMAQDFHAAFGLNGADDTHISTVDEGGVALAAIQGLNQKLEEQKAENAELKARLEKLEQLFFEKK
jgi:hypothetical protein